MKLNPQDHDRPVFFAPPMIRALLKGQKTQMRLVADLPPFRVEHTNCYDLPNGWMGSYPDGEAPAGATRKPWFVFDDPKMDGLISCMYNGRKPTPTRIRIASPQNYWNKDPKHAMEELVRLCPLGKSGDTLWVREPWGVHTRSAGGSLTPRPGGWLGLGYKADECGEEGHILDVDLEHTYWVKPPEPMWDHYREKARWQKWQAAIRMPRWAVRLLLRIDKVKLERLQDITEADAVAEGAVHAYIEQAERAEPGIKVSQAPYSVECFRQQWNLEHDKLPGQSWGDNPHVWSVTFNVEKCPLEIGEMK